MHDLGTLGLTSSSAQGINANGQVVGNAATGGLSHAFLYANGQHVFGQHVFGQAVALSGWPYYRAET